MIAMVRIGVLVGSILVFIFGSYPALASDGSGPLDVAFRGFPETRSYEIDCSVSDRYKIVLSFGAPEGIDMRGDGGGVAIKEVYRSSSPITSAMMNSVADELGNFASVTSVSFQCGWRQTIPDRESGNYLRMEISGLRNCLTTDEKQRLEEVGSIDRNLFVREVEISPSTIFVSGSEILPCAEGGLLRRDYVRPSKGRE